jgi:hypothetical protein
MPPGTGRCKIVLCQPVPYWRMENPLAGAGSPTRNPMVTESIASPMWNGDAMGGRSVMNEMKNRLAVLILPVLLAGSMMIAGGSASAQAVRLCDGQTSGINGVNGVFEGTPNNDVIVGTPGDDVIRGNGGDDLICGGGGNDHIEGNQGNDRIFGDGPVFADGTGDPNPGADEIFGEGPNAVLGGNDIVSAGAGNDTVFGGPAADRLSGNEGDDVIEGGAGNDNLNGNANNDVIRGNEGSDKLFGESGNDNLDGGVHPLFGGDPCEGGPGTDTFNRCEPAVD